jgi:hypothetical protein
VDQAAEHSVLIDYRTPRSTVLEAIEATYPGIRRENVHVWTLRGKSRAGRIGRLWEEWRVEGAHLVEDDWGLPSGMGAFTDSGTYAPTYMVGPWRDGDGQPHLFLVDGYAASAEAAQAASLAPMLGLEASLAVFTSRFELSYEREQLVMHLDPDHREFPRKLEEIIGKAPDDATVTDYRNMIREVATVFLDAGRGWTIYFRRNGDVLALWYMQPIPLRRRESANIAECVPHTVLFATPRVMAVHFTSVSPEGTRPVGIQLSRSSSIEDCRFRAQNWTPGRIGTSCRRWLKAIGTPRIVPRISTAFLTK